MPDAVTFTIERLNATQAEEISEILRLERVRGVTFHETPQRARTGWRRLLPAPGRTITVTCPVAYVGRLKEKIDAADHAWASRKAW